MKISKKFITSLIVIILLITIGLSYAYFSANISGGEDSTTITVTGGSMSMAFNGGNIITASNLLPGNDVVATKVFTVIGNNNTDLDMGYSLYLIVDENTFSNYAIQYKLTGDNTSSSGSIIEGNTELIPISTGASTTLLGFGTYTSPTSSSKVHTYTLELYFPSMPFNQNEDQGKTIKAHISIKDYSLENDRIMSSLDLREQFTHMRMYSYYEDKLWKEYNNKIDELSETKLAELENLANEYFDLSNALGEELIYMETFLNTPIMRNDIKSIEFIDSIETPSNILGSFDISEKQNGSVILWYEEIEEKPEENSYKITIGQNGGVNAPIHADFLFFSLKNLNSMVGDFKTLETTTMTGMFSSAGFNTPTFNLDLSNWDTSKVTDMSGMFSGAGFEASIFNLDISNWDTSNVTNMPGMFSASGFEASTYNLDLSNLDTSKVTNMSEMFQSAGSKASTFNLDLSKWSTSEVTDMSGMFDNSGFSATSYNLDISNWNTSRVINMSDMFYGAGYNSFTFNLDISNWDTSKVTDMSGMFSSVGYNASTFNLDLSNWDTSKVTDMSWMFSNSGYNSSIWKLGDLSNWNTSNVTNMYNMFYDSGYSATNWDIGNISNWSTANLAHPRCQLFINLVEQGIAALSSTITDWECNVEPV